MRQRVVVVGGTAAALLLVAACSGPLTIESSDTAASVSPAAEVQVDPPDAVAEPPAAGSGVNSLVRDTASADRRAPVTIGFAGDTSMHNGLHLLAPLSEAASILRLPDYMVVNLETSIAPPALGSPPVQKDFLFRSEPEMVQQLADAGIDAVSLANNHALDFGSEAVGYGIGLLDDAGIHTVGAGADADAAYKPIIHTIGDWTIGIAAFSRVPCDWSWTGRNTRPNVAWACPPFLDEADAVVSALVDDVDLAVVMVHGGTEGNLCPDQTMQGLNRRWASLGAGLVVNSHPHVVQGVTNVDETIIVNSTGNFAFPPAVGLSGNSAVFFATLSDRGLLLSIEPFVTDGGIVQPGSDARRKAIRTQVDQYSAGWRVLDDGRLIQDNSWPGLCATPPVP